MSPNVLPPNPNLGHLKKQAKDLLKSYQSGDLQVCTFLQKYLPRFANQSDREIIVSGISLHDAQHVVAQRYGFDKWSDLRGAVNERIAQGSSVPMLDNLNEKLRRHIDGLGFSTLSSYHIWCHKQGGVSAKSRVAEKF